MHLAAKHFKETSKLSAGKSVNNKLKQVNTKLKKRVNLAGKVRGGDLNRASISKKREKSHGSDAEFNDKLEFAKSSGLLGDLSKYKR